jgi:oxygen-independent coproporphyrinogen-3 oxidase
LAGKKYIGIGPSAHSYVFQKLNIANNSLYIKAVDGDKLPNEIEILSVSDRYNEYIMTGLRTIWGVSLKELKLNLGNPI